MKKGSRITTYIIIALIAGIILGFVLNKNVAPERIEKITEPFSLLPDVFLRLIKMIVAPLVFFYTGSWRSQTWRHEIRRPDRCQNVVVVHQCINCKPCSWDAVG